MASDMRIAHANPRARADHTTCADAIACAGPMDSASRMACADPITP